VIIRLRLLDRALGQGHRLFWKALQPQDPRQKQRRWLVDIKSDDPGLGVGGSIMIGDDTLEVTPRAALIAQNVVRVAHQLITDAPVGWLCRDGGELLGQDKGAPIANLPKAPERAQLVVGIAEVLGQIEGSRPSRLRCCACTPGLS